MGKDFWLERGQFDGSEWWEFKTVPMEPALTRELDFSEVYKLLAEMKQYRERQGEEVDLESLGLPSLEEVRSLDDEEWERLFGL